MKNLFTTAAALTAAFCLCGCAKGILDMVTVSSELQTPVTVSLQGMQSVLRAGQPMTVTAVSSPGLDSYEWRLDGSLQQEQGSAISVRSDQPGTHRLDLIVTSGETLCSTSSQFQVISVPVNDLLSQIDDQRVLGTAVDLAGFVSRQVGYPGNDTAGTYIHDRLASLPGMSVRYQCGSLRNIIATLPGEDGSSTAVWMMGAHYDSISSDPADAPGATDNACGVGIVLELARVMSGYRFKDTIQFASWNWEEQDMEGSRAFASETDQDIRLYFNYDSTCYSPGDALVLDIMHNAESEWVADMMVERSTLYRLGLTLTDNVHDCTSDHRAFWQQGFTAIMTHSQEHGPSHTPADTVDLISLPLARRNAQLGLAILTELAGLKAMR